MKGWPQLLKSSNYTYKTAATPFFIVLELSVTQLQNSIVCTTVVCTYSNLMPCPSFYRSSIILDLLQRAKSFGHGPQTKIIILKRKVNFDIDQNHLDQPKIFLTLGSSCVPSVATLSVYFPHKQHLSSSKNGKMSKELTVKCCLRKNIWDSGKKWENDGVAATSVNATSTGPQGILTRKIFFVN